MSKQVVTIHPFGIEAFDRRTIEQLKKRAPVLMTDTEWVFTDAAFDFRHQIVFVLFEDRMWVGCGDSACGGQCGLSKLVTSEGLVVRGQRVACGAVIAGPYVKLVNTVLLPEDVVEWLRPRLWF